MWRVRFSVQWNVRPVQTPIMLALNVAQKWTVGTECNSLVMLFVRMVRHSLGALLGGIEHNGCRCMH